MAALLCTYVFIHASVSCQLLFRNYKEKLQVGSPPESLIKILLTQEKTAYQGLRQK